MKQKLNEWLSIQVAKRPRRTILLTILFFNIVFLIFSAFLISNLALDGTESMGYFKAAFCTLTMILDPGCIQFVIADIGKSGVLIAIVCLIIVIVGMISFTGAVIGYTTNSISEFIEHSDAGKRKLFISNHVVILNWNTRASEIINDLLYCKERQKVVVLVNGRKREIENEISERMADTISQENEALNEACKDMNVLQKLIYKYKNHFGQNITVIVREGDVFSSRQLKDISLEKAKTVVILGADVNNTTCQLEQFERLKKHEKGNSQTIKTLMQVADITSADYSDDNQKIIVEVTDDWTLELVDKIIKSKQVAGKCNIVPICVNQILGQLLSQFSLMPELNMAYRELFSNKGATFYVEETVDCSDENTFIKEYLQKHRHAIPLTLREKNGVKYTYYSAMLKKHVKKISNVEKTEYSVRLNENYWIENKTVIILGHNSNCKEIMKGFNSFCNEWKYRNQSEEILKIIVIDDKDYLEKMGFYKEYPFVVEIVPANIYDKDLICETIERVVSQNTEDTSVLILSDDVAMNEDIDANALANLVYVQDIIRRKKEENPEFDENSIDIIVEIIDPKHHDIVSSYSVKNVVISNRYISKMITQIGEKEAIYDFYCDILTYDDANCIRFESKEIYVKKVKNYFDETPMPCTVGEFIRAVYSASENTNPAIVLGYVKNGEELILFCGDQTNEMIELSKEDKLVLFSCH